MSQWFSITHRALCHYFNLSFCFSFHSFIAFLFCSHLFPFIFFSPFMTFHLLFIPFFLQAFLPSFLVRSYHHFFHLYPRGAEDLRRTENSHIPRQSPNLNYTTSNNYCSEPNMFCLSNLSNAQFHPKQVNRPLCCKWGVLSKFKFMDRLWIMACRN